MKRFNKNECEKVRLEEVFKKVISGEWGEENIEDSENTVYIIRTTNFKNDGSIDIKEREVVKRKVEKSKIIDKKLEEKDIIIEKSGGSPNQPVGRVVYFNLKADKEFLCNNFTSILRTKDEIESKYIYYLLQKCYRERKVLKFQNKTTGIINLKLQDYLKSTYVYLPSLDEQKKIVEILDKVFFIIKSQKEELLELEKLSKCLFFEMFNSIDYIKLSLGECTSFIDYRGKTPKLSLDGKIRMINAKSVGKGFFKYISEFVTEEIYNNWMTRGLGQSGDILFVTEGHTFGNVCIIPLSINKFALGQRVITIRGENNKIINAYLYQYMQTEKFEKDINIYKTGGTAQGIRSKDLSKILIPIPPIELQNKFAERIRLIEKSKFRYLKMAKRELVS